MKKQIDQDTIKLTKNTNLDDVKRSKRLELNQSQKKKTDFVKSADKLEASFWEIRWLHTKEYGGDLLQRWFHAMVRKAGEEWDQALTTFDAHLHTETTPLTVPQTNHL